MAKIDDLITELEQQTTVIEGIDVLIQTLSDDLKAALKPDGPTAAKIDAAFQKVLTNKQKLADAITVNTPAEEEEPSEPPEAGKHNVRLGFSTTGGKESLFETTMKNNGVDEERAAELRSLFEAARSGADAQESDGEEFTSTFSFSDNDTSDSFELDNEAKKAAADVAVAEAVLQKALAQLSKFQKPE